MSLISVDNLTKTYVNDDVETPALRGVSFQINPGEFVAIIGPSGCGKSTLLHLLGFLEAPTAGTYQFDGRVSTNYSPEELAAARNHKMGFVFQAFNLLARASVYQNVRLPLLYSRVPEGEWDQRVRAAITAVGLSHRTDHLAGRLSGGEKQRTAIARALVVNPAVIFADEPTGNLDSASGAAVMQIINGLHRDGHTIVLITHDASVARQASRIIRMRDGKIEDDKKS